MEFIGTLPYPIGSNILYYLSKGKTLMTIYGLIKTNYNKKKYRKITLNVICDKDTVSEYIENKLKDDGKNDYKIIVRANYNLTHDMMQDFDKKPPTYDKYLEDVLKNGILNIFKNGLGCDGYANIKLDNELGEKLYYEKMLKDVYDVGKKRILLIIHGEYIARVSHNSGEGKRIFIQNTFLENKEISEYFRNELIKFKETGESNDVEKYYNILKNDKWYRYEYDEDLNIENLVNDNYDWNEHFRNFTRRNCFYDIDTYLEKSVLSIEKIE